MGNRYGDVVGSGVIDFLVTGFPVPIHARAMIAMSDQGLDAQFETDLVVAFACRAVGDGIGAFLVGDVDQMFCDQRGRAKDVPSRYFFS